MDTIPVTDLKQWVYCPRIVYYRRVAPVVGKATFKMKEAHAAQDLVEGLEMRRTLTRYGLTSAVRRFGVWMNDAEVGLSGKADLVLEAETEVYVVDFKLTSGDVGENHRMQLAGYSMLAERYYGREARRAFLYRIPDGRVFDVEIGPELRCTVEVSVRDMNRMADEAALPDPTSVRGRCVECEYANYCADIW